jgi:hypothetical protein
LRKLIVAAAALAFAAPALAQPIPYSDPRDEEIARSLPHPYDVEEAGDKMGRAVGAILDVPIGGVVQAVDPTSRVRRNETIADVAGRDDPYFEERVQDKLHGLTLGAADLVRQMAVVAPALRRSLDDLRRNMDQALNRSGY